MTVGIGIDLVEVSRLERSVASYGSGFLSRIFQEHELERIKSHSDNLPTLVMCFAVKEACMKALGTGIWQGVGFRQIEVSLDSRRAPAVHLTGNAAKRAEELRVSSIQVSMTQESGVAAAVVLLSS